MYLWILWVGSKPLPFRTDTKDVPSKDDLKALLGRKGLPGGAYNLQGPFEVSEFEDLIPATPPEPSPPAT